MDGCLIPHCDLLCCRKIPEIGEAPLLINTFLLESQKYIKHNRIGSYPMEGPLTIFIIYLPASFMTIPGQSVTPPPWEDTRCLHERLFSWTSQGSSLGPHSVEGHTGWAFLSATFPCCHQPRLHYPASQAHTQFNHRWNKQGSHNLSNVEYFNLEFLFFHIPFIFLLCVLKEIARQIKRINEI
jgi:hypothetical protein